MKKSLLCMIGKFIFKIRGWSFEPVPGYWEHKQVLIGLPHVEFLDTFMAFARFAIMKKQGHILVKKEAFLPFLSPMLKKLGAIPVDRSSPGGLVQQMISEFSSRENFQLSIVPSGTRKSGAKIRSGFWHIAKGAQVPIVCCYFDQINKRTRWLGQFLPTDDLQADLQHIKAIYHNAGLDISQID